MRHPIKIMIKKPRPIGVDWHKYEPVPNGKLLLDETSPIKTEAQFAKFIFDNWGAGRYQVIAWQKGYKGLWLFWLGDITATGFTRDKNKNKDVEKLKGSLYKAESFDEKREIEEEMDLERELWEMDRRTKRRGPRSLKVSRAGTFHSFGEF